jgi:hypothetical protein
MAEEIPFNPAYTILFVLVRSNARLGLYLSLGLVVSCGGNSTDTVSFLYNSPDKDFSRYFSGYHPDY